MIIDPNKVVERGWVTPSPFSRIQQNGIDLSWKSLRFLADKISELQEYHPQMEVTLHPGAYEIEFNELVRVPVGHAAQIITRSSINRQGAFITAGLYDGGFRGRIGAVLHVTYEIKIFPNDRLAQIVFMQGGSQTAYAGQYQDCKLEGAELRRPEAERCVNSKEGACVTSLHCCNGMSAACPNRSLPNKGDSLGEKV